MNLIKVTEMFWDHIAKDYRVKGSILLNPKDITSVTPCDKYTSIVMNGDVQCDRKVTESLEKIYELIEARANA